MLRKIIFILLERKNTNANIRVQFLIDVNPLMAIGNYSYQFLICCPRDCVSRHKGGTSVPPLNPSESIVLSEHYRLWGV